MKKISPLLMTLMSFSLFFCNPQDDQSIVPSSQLFKTLAAENVSFTDAVLQGEISPDKDEIFECGFVWGKSSDLNTSASEKKYFGPISIAQKLSHKISGLEMNTTYYYKTFIITKSGVSYGELISLKTLTLTWNEQDGFPSESRTGAISFVINNKAYVAMGHGRDADGNIVFYNDLWEFDMVKNQWKKKSDFPESGRSGAFAFAIDNKGYVGTGGSKTGGTKDFWEYNPSEDKWTRKADYLGGNVGWATAFSIAGKGYAGVGMRNGNAEMLKDFYEYDPSTDEWAQRKDFPGIAVNQAVGFSIEGKGYIGMGLRAESWLGHTHQLWEYNPGMDEWTERKECPSTSEMFGSIAFVINNKAYVGLGGYGGDKIIWEYNPAINEWNQHGEFAGPGRLGSVAYTLGDRGIIGTGSSSSSFYKDFVEYKP